MNCIIIIIIVIVVVVVVVIIIFLNKSCIVIVEKLVAIMQMDGEDSSCALHSTPLLLCDNVCSPRIFCTSLVTCLVCTWHLLSHYIHLKREVL